MGAVKDFHDITTRAKDILVVHIVRDVIEMEEPICDITASPKLSIRCVRVTKRNQISIFGTIES